MKLLKLIFRNAFRHKLRSILTIVGVAIAVLAFALIRTVIDGWNYGVDAASANRLIVHHKVSFIYTLPLSYGPKIQSIRGIENVSYFTWFGGIYKDTKPTNFFPRIPVDTENFLKVYPEYIVPPDQLEAFKKQRNGAVVGAKTAKQFGFKIGDVIPIRGDIYPGDWEFVVRAIYTGKDRTVDETLMFFHWEYLNESLKETMPSQANHVGWYVVKVGKPSESPRIASQVDAMFKNSSAETLTETEKAFNQNFVSMSGAILRAIHFISFVIIGIILLVLANTMAMTARERITEYAVFKTLGFTSRHLVTLVAGESLIIAALGGALGLVVAFPVCRAFGNAFPTMFPVFAVSNVTVALCVLAALLVGFAAALFPAVRASKMSIVDGLRYVG